MTKHIKISEEDLIALLVARDMKGMEVLYDKYSGALYGLIYRIVKRDEIAEHVLHDAFLKIWTNFSHYDSTKNRLFTWLINIARNLSIEKIHSKDFMTQSKNHSPDKIVTPTDPAKDESYNTINAKGLKGTIINPAFEHQPIIDLIFFEGYSKSDAAEKLGVLPGDVITISRIASMQLRNQFDKVELN